MKQPEIVLFTDGSDASTVVRDLLRERDVEFVEASAALAARYPGLHRPSAIINGRVYEGITQIADGITFALRF